jgi:hypothetical protein
MIHELSFLTALHLVMDRPHIAGWSTMNIKKCEVHLGITRKQKGG